MTSRMRIAVAILTVVAVTIGALQAADIFPIGSLALKIVAVAAAAVAGTIAVLKSGGIVSVLLPLALVAAVGASGCATWQQTTKTSLDAASAAAETAHVAVRTHFDAKCEAIARDCAKAKLPACPSLVTCQEERHKPIVALSGIQAACLVGYSAIVIADKGTALQKAAEVARLVGDLLAALKLVGVKL